MLLSKDTSGLLVIDMQEKLIPFIASHEKVVAHVDWLMSLAIELRVPLIVSEQYPSGLGPTLSSLQAKFTSDDRVEKVHFSCGASDDCMAKIQTKKRQQWVLCGIETHVCVLQSALLMAEAGLDIFVVVDAVGSRHQQDREVALERMVQSGVQLVTREMVFFEWVHRAGTPEFKALSKRFMQKGSAA